MDITRHWVSSFLMLCHSCLAFNKWNACSVGLRSDDWLGHSRIFEFFVLIKLLGCFGWMFWVIVHLYYETPPNQFGCVWQEFGSSQYVSEHLRIHPAASVLCHIINKRWWPRAITLPPPCFTDTVVCFGSWAVPLFSSHHSGRGWSWFHLPWESSSRAVMAFLEVQSSLSITEAYEWIAPFSERSVFTFMQSSLYGRLGHWYAYLLDSVVHLAGCCEGVSPNIVAISQMGFFLFSQLKDGLLHLHGELPWSHVVFTAESSKYKHHTSNQLQAFYMLNWWWYNEGTAHTCPWNSLWVNCPITFGPF